MQETVFRILIPGIPLSNNATNSRVKDRFREYVASQISLIQSVYSFSTNDRFYGRVIYFNHEKIGIRDIHNIFKPMFDALEGHAYDDDKHILHFEGIRLDMEYNSQWFEIEFVMQVPNLERALLETCCLIEIARLSSSSESAVNVTWLV